MKHTLLAVLAAAAFFAPAASAAAANKEHQQLMADIRMLQEQAQLLQNLLGTLNESIKAVNARLDEQSGASRKAFADQKLIIDTLSGDVRVVREKLDDNNVRLGSLAQEVDALRQALQQITSRATATGTGDTPDPGASAASAAAPGTATAPTAAAGAAPAPVVAVSPQKIQEAALADYGAGQYDVAIDGFVSYIRNFPKADWADDAQLYICRSYILDGKYDKAVDACDAVIRNYPTGNAVPDAYYQKGIAQKTLKDAAAARATWEALIQKYPDSDAARLARQGLAGLGRP